MSEPEDLIAEAALHAVGVVRDVWRRRTHDADDDRPTLARLRRRLELLSTAVFPGTREILAAEAPAPATLLWRLAHGSPSPGTGALASTDGDRIWLPRELSGSSPGTILERYRLLVLEQAARAARGTWRESSIDPLTRDLYVLCESAAVDAQLARSLPGLAGALREARFEALTARPTPRRMLPTELVLETTLRALLRADPLGSPRGLPESDTPAFSMDWARAEAESMRRRHGRYRGIAPVTLWGGMPPPPDDASGGTHEDADHERLMPRRMRTLLRRPRARIATDEDDASTGTWIVRTDDPQEKAEDAGGLQRPSDRDADANSGELADALAELPELRVVRTPQRVSETLVSDTPLRRIAAVEHVQTIRGVVYPEWDWRAHAYRVHGAIVRPCRAVMGDPAWASRTLERHAALVRAVRRDFERLRPRRSARPRQPHGSEVDIDGYIMARADACGTGAMSDHYYVDARPRRRDAAIMLLLDASASTDSWVAGDRRVIDVEKEALLVVCEALRVLGDQHAAFAFSGEGPERVQLSEVVGFGDVAAVETVRARIAGLEPDGFTRMGAALRHGSAMLSRQAAHRRLLLLLSDGRPNDTDVYEGRYGIEDTRAAVMEARRQGVHCFCLTVDREAPQYAPRIFGTAHFAVLPCAERLPCVLLALLRRLIRGD